MLAGGVVRLNAFRFTTLPNTTHTVVLAAEVTQSSSMLGNTSNAKRPREDSAMAVDDAGAHEMAVDATQPTDQLAAGDKKMRSDGAGTGMP